VELPKGYTIQTKNFKKVVVDKKILPKLLRIKQLKMGLLSGCAG